MSIHIFQENWWVFGYFRLLKPNNNREKKSNLHLMALEQGQNFSHVFFFSFLLFIAFLIIYVPFIDGKSQVDVIKTTNYKMPNLFKQVIMIMGRQISICKQNAQHSREKKRFFFLQSRLNAHLPNRKKSNQISFTTWTLIFYVYPRIDQFVTDKEIDFFFFFEEHSIPMDLNFSWIVKILFNWIWMMMSISKIYATMKINSNIDKIRRSTFYWMKNSTTFLSYYKLKRNWMINIKI